MDGLRTPLILHNPNEPYKYDEDITVPFSGKFYFIAYSRVSPVTKSGKTFIVDWYHDDYHKGLDTFMSVYNPTGAEPVPRELPSTYLCTFFLSSTNRIRFPYGKREL